MGFPFSSGVFWAEHFQGLGEGLASGASQGVVLPTPEELQFCLLGLLAVVLPGVLCKALSRKF